MLRCGGRAQPSQLRRAQATPRRFLQRSAEGPALCRRSVGAIAAVQRRPRPDDQLFDDHLLVKDLVKEQDVIRQRRRTFTFERWAAHRSTSRYLRHILGIWRSSTFKGLSQPMMFLTALATGVCCYEEARDMGMVPGDLYQSVQLTDAPFQLTSFALALLLVFRTDNSYARWLSALQTWTEVKNTSKTIVRNTTFWVKDRYLQQLISRWTIAYSKSLMAHVRNDIDLEKELEPVLFPHELAALRASDSPPQYAIYILTALLNSAGLSAGREERMALDLQFFEKAYGTCEQLLRYPIPLGYTRHTSRFMIVYLSFLPFALWDDCHWAVIPIVGAVSFLLLGIEEIGVMIEEPHAIMPLEDICTEIARDVLHIVDSNAAVTGLVRRSYTSQAGISNLGSADMDDLPPMVNELSRTGITAANLLLREQDLLQDN